MNKEALLKLSKEELASIILDLDSKYGLEGKVILPLNVDYRALLEATSDIIFVIDKDENLVYRNSAWKMLYPSTGDETFGEHYSNYLPDIEKERGGFVFKSVIRDGKVFDSELMKTFDESGKAFYFIASFSPIRSSNGDIMGLIGTMKNITERHHLEKKYKDSSRVLEEKIKELLRQSDEIKELRGFSDDIIKNSPIGIFTMDPTGIMLSENPALKRIMGRKPDETIVGVNLLNHIGFKQAGFDKLFDEGIRTKKPMRINNANYVPYVGGIDLIINVTMDPILDKHGNVEKVIIMVEDNTEQAKMIQRTSKAERLSSLGFLASGVALELRNNLVQMAMDLNFVGNQVDKNSPAAEYVDSLKEELDGIKNISEQLLSLSITDEADKEICELGKMINNHPIDLMINRLRNDGFNVNVELPAEDPKVRASSNQIQQIIIQTLENAAEAMPDKGRIDLTVEPINTEKGKFVFLTITDHGMGISDENLKRIFQPFFTTKGKKATGLGLMIVSTIVENLGGSIGIKSRPGEGTSIKIALPVVV